jgi:hypothetical protein
MTDLAEVAAILRRVLDEVDAGELDADDVERAYLAGSADAFERVSVPSY